MMKEKSNKKHRLPLFILHNDSTSKTLTEKLNYPKPDELLTNSLSEQAHLCGKIVRSL